MAWTEDGFERHVLAPRRALRLRMADRLEEEADDMDPGELGGADSGRLAQQHYLRALAGRLRDAAA